jgi:hypothetical protein
LLRVTDWDSVMTGRAVIEVSVDDSGLLVDREGEGVELIVSVPVTAGDSDDVPDMEAVHDVD